MLKVKFTFDKMVTYWNHEKGANVDKEGNFKNEHWSIDVGYLDKTFSIDSKNEIEKVLKNHLKKNYLPNDYFCLIDDRLTFNTIEGNDDILSGNEQETYFKNNKQMFICDYSIFIEIMEAYEPNNEELEKLFPSAEF